MTYLIPRTLKHETKIFKKLYVKDLVYIGLILALAYMFKGSVHNYLLIPYWLFAFITAFYMVVHPKSNPQKRKWQALSMFIFRNNKTYYSINRAYYGKDD